MIQTGSPKTFLIDTNVLVHDANAIKKFKQNQVIIALSVLEELDSLKRHGDEVGKNAREVMRYIDSLKQGDLRQGVTIPEGPTVRVYLDSMEEHVKGFPLARDRWSNQLIFVAYQLKAKGERVVIVSKDFVTRVKAEALGIEAEDYENLKVSYRQIYHGIRPLDVTKRDLDLFFKDGVLDSVPHDHFPNEYLVLKAPESHPVIVKYNGRLKKLEQLQPVQKEIWGISPLNVEQKCAIDLLLRDDIPLVTLVGRAGTGKTLLALAVGMKKVFDDGVYSKILVSRPIVPLGKDIGYLPGTKEEKLSHWMQPIYDNLEFLCTSTHGAGNARSALDFILETRKIEMEAVTYIRGRSLPKMYIIIDEAQNLTPHEVKTIISRAGKNTKVILTGDPTQIDNPYMDQDSNGLTYAVSRFKHNPLYGHIFLEKTERSELASMAADIL